MDSQDRTRRLDSLTVNRLPIRLVSEDRRVITRPFGMSYSSSVPRVFCYVAALPEDELERRLGEVLDRFRSRHENIEQVFEENCQTAARAHGCAHSLGRSGRLLVGSYLTMEYSIESAALFNPSIVPHPDQEGLRNGGERFIMSLRATGEGHVSSVVFRTGVINGKGHFRMDPPALFSAPAKLSPDQHYLKWLFQRTLREMGVNMRTVDLVLHDLPDQFDYAQLDSAVRRARGADMDPPLSVDALDSVLWLGRSNYRLQLPDDADLSDIIIFPENENEARGIEDVRLVRFADEDGVTTYYGTYTASNGHRILPMLLETRDFTTIDVHTMNGACARNKGMALFPRRINGHYVMCSRIDGKNLFIMYSDYVHFWESAQLLAEPKYRWELMLIGNGGSPIETPEGWLLLTHGVGPMRRYCIGAMLLDLDNPLKIIGRLPEPLLEPTEAEREGYVPNVLYSCGAMVHAGQLYLPYAMSDRATSVATVDIEELLGALRQSPDGVA